MKNEYNYVSHLKFVQLFLKPGENWVLNTLLAAVVE